MPTAIVVRRTLWARARTFALMLWAAASGYALALILSGPAADPLHGKNYLHQRQTIRQAQPMPGGGVVSDERTLEVETLEHPTRTGREMLIGEALQ